MALKLITWNMQGVHSLGEEGKWSWVVRSILLQEKPAFLCLQECGAPPEFSPVDMDLHFDHMDEFTHRVYKWNLGSSGKADRPARKRPFYIFWMETDLGGRRVNLAMCSSMKPLEYCFARGIGKKGLRPAIGIRTEQAPREVYWSLHAASGSGGDAPALLDDIDEASGVCDWAALGDFNVEPDVLEHRMSSRECDYRYQVCTTDTYTRPASEKRLDYMVLGKTIYRHAPEGIVKAFVSSDHQAVQYDL